MKLKGCSQGMILQVKVFVVGSASSSLVTPQIQNRWSVSGSVYLRSQMFDS